MNDNKILELCVIGGCLVKCDLSYSVSVLSSNNSSQVT